MITCCHATLVRMSQYFNAKKIFEFTLLLAAITTLVTVSFHLANFVGAHDGAREIVARFGYAGVFIVSFISGISVILPVPPAAFVPIFSAAGLTTTLIIAALTVGTIVTDFVGYTIGLWSKGFIASHYPKIHDFLVSLNVKHHALLFPTIVAYTSISPFPNEALVIPLAVIGIPFSHFLLPLTIGTVCYHALTVYGIQNLFAYFF